MPCICCVPGCNGNYRNRPKVSVYSFPMDEQLKERWLLAIRRKDHVVTHSSRVCGRHFKETDFEQEASAYDKKMGRILTAPLNRARIKKGAVPSLFLPKSSNKSLNKQLAKGISLEDKEVPQKQNRTRIPPENCRSKNAPVSNLPLQNKNEKNPPKRQNKRKRKFSRRTTSNKVNNNSEDCHLNNNQVTSSNENSIDKNHSLSNDSQSLPPVCIKSCKVEEPWEEEYNYVGNSSGDEPKDCDKMQIEIRDVRSVVSNENKSSSTEIVDKNSEKISDSASILGKPLKISKREETFGKFVASEISDLSENPELYIKAKQSILNILVEAHFEQMKFS